MKIIRGNMISVEVVKGIKITIEVFRMIVVLT